MISSPTMQTEIAPRPVADADAEIKLDARHVNFFYGDFQALEDASLAVQARRITALIGPSGCGKTTFLRIFNLMDEPASALDPIATLRIEELMQDLKKRYTIVIVTHNMQQASRVSDFTAFMLMNQRRAGEVIEFGPTDDIFNRPKESRTEDYITGRFG